MLNDCAFHGRLTKDPELRRTNAGKAVTSFTLAVDRDIKNQDGGRDADFIDCVAWNQLAEFVHSYFRKGQEAIACGWLQSRKWQDKNGNNRVSWEINCSKVEFCGSRQDGGRDATSSGAYAPPSHQGEGYAGGNYEELADDGDLPF